MHKELLQSLKFEKTNVAAPNTSQILHAIVAGIILVNSTLVATMKDEIFQRQFLHITSVALKATRWHVMDCRMNEHSILMAKDRFTEFTLIELRDVNDANKLKGEAHARTGKVQYGHVVTDIHRRSRHAFDSLEEEDKDKQVIVKTRRSHKGHQT